MQTKALATGCAVFWASIFLPPSALASDVGRRFPPERRTLVDTKTGVTITALTTSPANDAKIYQTHPQWTADGKYIVFRSDRGRVGRSQAFAISEDTGEIIQLTDGPDVRTGSLCLARRANRLYYFRGRQLVEFELDPLLRDSQTGAIKDSARYERVIMAMPEGLRESGGFTLDADETKAYVGVGRGQRELGGIRSIDLQTGEIATIIDLPFRVGHVQANPFVPGEIVYCHETGGDAPQRMWFVRADGTDNQPLYRETPDEWVTHEVWLDRDHVLFNIMGHRHELRTKPHGIASINVRSQEIRLHGQAGGQGYWHCAGTEDRQRAVGDTFTGELYLISLITGEKTLLTTGHRPQGDRTHSHHNFSPDGKRVLFNSGLLGSSDLMTITLPAVRDRP